MTAALANDLLRPESDRHAPAWERAGRVFPAGTTAAQALPLAGLEYQLRKLSLQAILPVEDGADGIDSIAFNTKVGLYRAPTRLDREWREIWPVGHRYRFLQNSDVAELIDRNLPFDVRAAGDQDFGRRVYFVLRAGEHNIEFRRGEQQVVRAIDEYFLLHDRRDYGCLTITYAPVDRESGTILQFGEKSSTTTIKIVHSTNHAAEVNVYMGLMGQLQDARSRGIAELTQLLSTVATLEDAQWIIGQVYPIPVKSSKVILAEGSGISLASIADKKVKDLTKAEAEVHTFRLQEARARALQETVLELVRRGNDEQPGIADSLYNVVNAINCLEDHRAPGKDEAREAMGILFDAAMRRKAMAFDAALSIAQRKQD